MPARKSISSAPRDGRKITVYWMDEDEQENESIAQYRSLDRLKAGGGDWDESDTGWWTFTDSRTQRKIEPSAWLDESVDGDDEEEAN
ncbi:MAG: hypothetical protein ACRECW_14790 [Phyllobacterium sp.]